MDAIQGWVAASGFVEQDWRVLWWETPCWIREEDNGHCEMWEFVHMLGIFAVCGVG